MEERSIDYEVVTGLWKNEALIMRLMLLETSNSIGSFKAGVGLGLSYKFEGDQTQPHSTGGLSCGLWTKKFDSNSDPLPFSSLIQLIYKDRRVCIFEFDLLL
ncbi:hypothetical protein HAX54_003690 [Datura stramonium]|uniref:Uncharacterized protein n=1 Tax=Datura stramonium TaxID=4076 RepID=A0ABS8RTM3_DATST|nr:hypothetical protein [Datura stramonium]